MVGDILVFVLRNVFNGRIADDNIKVFIGKRKGRQIRLAYLISKRLAPTPASRIVARCRGRFIKIKAYSEYRQSGISVW